jgi:AcrR family transcriptional regulator
MNMVQEKNERRSNLSTQRRPRQATTARHEELRRHLLALAERIVEAEGLAALRARDLAEAAGCSVGAIYNVFAELDELILEVNANTLRAIDAEMSAVAQGSPLEQFCALADAYIGYATRHRRRWEALFTFRMPEAVLAPDWFMLVQAKTFSHIEAPLAALRPEVPAAARAALARGIFAAVHGMVAFGLDKRLSDLDVPSLQTQVREVVTAIALGLARGIPSGQNQA